MPRCKNCKEKFVVVRFLQKYCQDSDCRIAEREDQSIKISQNTKPKKQPICKGLLIAKDHGCKLPQDNRINGLGVECGCYAKWLLNTPEGSAKLKRITLTVTAPRMELAKAFVEKKERVKLGTLLINVRNVVHKLVKIRDHGKPCISCGIPWHDNFQAGHFYKAELYSNLKFDINNINGQCPQCNLRKEGNESGYRAGIMQRYGKEQLHYLDSKAMSYKKNEYHWDREELMEIRTLANDILRKLDSKVDIKKLESN
jgi:hypothetical protein